MPCILVRWLRHIMSGSSGGDEMKPGEFPLFESSLLPLQVNGSSPIASVDWRMGETVSVFLDGQECFIAQGNSLSPLAVTSLPRVIRQRLSPQMLFMPTLLEQAEGSLFQVRISSPSSQIPVDEPIKIAIDGRAIEVLHRSGLIPDLKVDSAIAILSEEFVVTEDRASWSAVLKPRNGGPGDWRLQGRRWRLQMETTADGRILIRRVERGVRRDASWHILEHGVQFIDATPEALKMNAAQQSLLEQSIVDNGSYIELWKRYGEIEWQRNQRSASDLGCLRYRRSSQDDEGEIWWLRVDPEERNTFELVWKDRFASGNEEVEATESMPEWAENTQQAHASTQQVCRGRPEFTSKDPGLIGFICRDAPPEEGVLHLSLAGDRTVQQRREKARALIESRVRMPQLQYLLQDVPFNPGRPDTRPALTRYARECFKDGKATKRQEDAIKVALNTPDVALIIGPPGTGKTQVIAALQRRLAEIAESERLQHQVLISSFQHDAVENALDRTRVFGLPGIKIGARRDAGKQDDLLVRWCREKEVVISATVSDREGLDPATPILKRISRHIAELRHGYMTPKNQREHLSSLDKDLEDLELLGLVISAQLASDWRDYLKASGADNCVPVSGEDSRRLLRFTRALRTSVTSFEDDGVGQIESLLVQNALSGGLKEHEISMLYALRGAETVTEQQCAIISEICNAVIDRCSDYRPPEIRNRIDESGMGLLMRIESEISTRLQDSRLGLAGILASYRDAYQHDPDEVRRAVEEYVAVVGATCQQADSKGMINLKKVADVDAERVSFETVVIDEAARANPLDLFVPMSMATRRLVLVGDPRQLPHLLEPEIEEELSTTHDLTREQRDIYKESLFQRLWHQLERREQADGVKRVVMLDEQFRMHPALGDFVSKHFYESEGLDQVRSGRTDSEFLNDIPGYEGSYCAWEQVPRDNKEGREQQSKNRSWFRIAEAKRIAECVKTLIDNCDDSTTIGVITFYSAQRERIFEQLEKAGIAEYDHDSRSWQIATPYRYTAENEERLRVGTVDAFQGKEFDIVLLSMVRANNKQIPVPNSDMEAFREAVRKKYGHLCLSNRLNVAMSRQRSLLIVFGDKTMLEGQAATHHEAVPGLVAFHQLCLGKGQ